MIQRALLWLSLTLACLPPSPGQTQEGCVGKCELTFRYRTAPRAVMVPLPPSAAPPAVKPPDGGSQTTIAGGDNSCEHAFDGVCDAPPNCRIGTDSYDCAPGNKP